MLHRTHRRIPPLRLALALAVALAQLLIGAPPAGAASSPSQVIIEAAQQSLEARTYQATSSIALENIAPSIARALGILGRESLAIQSVSGTYYGEDLHTLQTLDPLFGGEWYPERGLEMKLVGGQLYLHGPLPLLGAPEERWYVSETGEARFLLADQLVLLRGLLNVNLKSMARQGSERLDGGTCTIYSYGNRSLLKSAIGKLLDGEIDATRVLNPRLLVSVCGDGNIHHVKLTYDFDCGCRTDQVQGRDDQIVLAALPAAPRAAATTVTYVFELRMSGFGRQRAIDAPRDAAQLMAPSLFGGLTALVFNGGNIRAEPSLRGKVLGQLHAGQQVLLLERTADGRWYYVSAPEATGWVSVTLLTLPEGVSELVPIRGAAARTDTPPASGALMAQVFNGGNLRATPDRAGRVLDQINAGERVTLLARRGAWYQITNARQITGWVHQSLLTVDPAVARQVPQR